MGKELNSVPEQKEGTALCAIPSPWSTIDDLSIRLNYMSGDIRGWRGFRQGLSPGVSPPRFMMLAKSHPAGRDRATLLTTLLPEPNLPLLPLRRHHQLADGIEDHDELLIVANMLLLQLFEGKSCS